MELIVNVDESKAKQLIGFLKTLEYVEVKKSARKKIAREPRFDYFGADPDWQLDVKTLRSTRKKAQW